MDLSDQADGSRGRNADVRRGLVFAAIAAVCWGLLAILLKRSLTLVSVTTTVWLRFTIAGSCLTVYQAWKRPRELRIFARPPLLGVVAGICLAANYYGFIQGLSLTSASHAQVLIQMGPVLLAVFGIFYFGETLTRLQKVGCAVAALGFFLFYRSQLAMVFASLGQSAEFVKGNIWLLFGSITWAVWAVAHKNLLPRFSVQAINGLVYAIGSLLFLPAVDWRGLGALSFWEWILMISLGLNTLIAYGSVGEALRLAPANQVSFVISLNPLLTLALMFALAAAGSTWVAPEPLTVAALVGAMVMIGGVVMVTGGSRRRART